MALLDLKKAMQHKSTTQLQPEKSLTDSNSSEEAPAQNAIASQRIETAVDENADKLERLESESLLHLDMPSVREAVRSGDMRKLRKAGQRNKKNEANDIVITAVSDEAFVNFKTFVPVSGNIFGKDIAHGKAVHLTVENEKFIKKLMLDQDVRKNAVVNHIIDVVRIYFNK